MRVVQSRYAIFITTLLFSFALTRAYLHWSPYIDVKIFGFVVHHLFFGVLLMMGAGVPLVILETQERINRLLVFLFAFGLMLALDEFIFLIVTSGSDAEYIQPASLIGACVCIAVAAAYATVLRLTVGK